VQPFVRDSSRHWTSHTPSAQRPPVAAGAMVTVIPLVPCSVRVADTGIIGTSRVVLMTAGRPKSQLGSARHSRALMGSRPWDQSERLNVLAPQCILL
jgi:hypothetical protein